MTQTTYYNHIRQDVLAHVPSGVRRVLSVGCGSGHTEAELVARGVAVTGIEMNPDAAKAAARAGITVICGDAQNIDLGNREELFDCLIYADVLEHMSNPQSVLRNHAQLLGPSGIVIVSVPNFRHYSVLRELFLAGHVRYQDAGILDRTHLRITTRRMVQEWFTLAGLTTTQIDCRMNRRRDRLLSTLSFGFMREFIATQVIVVGRRAGVASVSRP